MMVEEATNTKRNQGEITLVTDLEFWAAGQFKLFKGTFTTVQRHIFKGVHIAIFAVTGMALGS